MIKKLLSSPFFVFVSFGVLFGFAFVPENYKSESILLIGFLFLVSYSPKPNGRIRSNDPIIMILALGMINAILIFQSGGIESHYFFLTFSVLMLSSSLLGVKREFAIISGIFLSYLIYHVIFPLKFENIQNIIMRIGSLAAFSPLAYYFSSETTIISKEEKSIQNLQKVLSLYEREDKEISDTVHSGLIILDENYIIVEISKSAHLLLVAENNIGDNFFERNIFLSISPSNKINPSLIQTLQNGKDIQEKRVIVSDGETSIPLVLSISPSTNRKKFDGGLVILEDARVVDSFIKFHEENS